VTVRQYLSNGDALMRKLFLALVALTVACGDSTTEPTMSSIAGTWELQTVNGAALPYVIFQQGTEKVELTADVFTVTSTGTFTELSTIRTTSSGQTQTETETDAGTYTLNGTAVTFKFDSDPSSPGTGSISGNTLTVADAGFALVYKKK
jgi:hypothetical protein